MTESPRRAQPADGVQETLANIQRRLDEHARLLAGIDLRVRQSEKSLTDRQQELVADVADLLDAIGRRIVSNVNARSEVLEEVVRDLARTVVASLDDLTATVEETSASGEDAARRRHVLLSEAVNRAQLAVSLAVARAEEGDQTIVLPEATGS